MRSIGCEYGPASKCLPKDARAACLSAAPHECARVGTRGRPAAAASHDPGSRIGDGMLG